MDSPEQEATIEVDVDGEELAILVGCTSLSAGWPFRTEEAFVLRASRGPHPWELSDIVGRQARRILSDAGLLEVRPGGWTSAFIAARAATRGTLVLSPEELQRLVIAVHMCLAEFGPSEGAWHDFLMAAPGALGDYGVIPNDLLALATRLEGKLQPT